MSFIPTVKTAIDGEHDEAQHGPLRAENARDTVYWSWTDDPWPWEGGGY